MGACRHYAAGGYAVLAGDGPPHIIGWNIKNGRYRRGRRITTPVSLSRKRFYSFGAPSRDGSGCRFYKKAGGDGFCDFLGYLHKKHGRFVMFVDNASYHKSKKASEAPERFGGNVVLEYFLPYTPELNPVEVQWRGIKKGTANTLYEGIEAMQRSIKAMLGNGEVRIVKMVSYLTP